MIIFKKKKNELTIQRGESLKIKQKYVKKNKQGGYSFTQDGDHSFESPT